MKRTLLSTLFVFCIVMSTRLAHATCTSDIPDHPIVKSFTLTPSTIAGDESSFATGTVQACIPDGTTNGLVSYMNPSGFSATQTICYGGYLNGSGCTWPGVGTGNVTVTFATNGYNHGTTNQNGTYGIEASGYPPLINQPITVTPIPPLQPDPTQPPCNNGCGHPINATTGNTWIRDDDYSMPGIGGGLSLTRMWNSLWANMSPPEESGIFGDSWRSNFEERIQLQGQVATYWLGDGSARFFTYDGINHVYYMSAPADDPTTLSFNSNTNLWTITLLNGTQKIFNQAGYLTSIVDLNGNATTINIDATHQNRIASVTDPSGHVLTFNYANASFPRLCTSISDSVGTFTQYQYDTATSRLTQVLYPDGSQHNYQYSDPNSNTLVSLVTDSMNKTMESHTYDSQRRGLTSQQANDSSGSPVNKVTVTYAYQGQSYQNLVCDSTGNDCVTVQVSTRAQRHYISVTSGPATNACTTCVFGGKSKATFDSSGYQSSSTDGNGNITVYNHDIHGNLLSQSQRDYFNSGWDTWNYTYNSFGEVLTATDPLGVSPGDPNHTTTNGYDAHGNLTSITTPSPDGGITPASVTTFTPNAQGQVTQIKDPLLNTATIVYCTTNQTNCPYGLIYYVKDAKGNKTTYAYDGRGNRTSVTDATNHVTSYQYDPMNRLTLITYPTSPATTVQFHYDWRGRRDYVIDQNGNKTSYGYDDADRLLTITDAQSPTSGVTTYKYDTENNLTDIWDANNNHTQFLYYPGAYLYKTIFPSGLYETYAWDSDNNLQYKTDRNSNTINYSYDYQNHLLSKQQPSTGYTVKYTYDPAGRLTQVQDSNTGATGTYTFGYDNMNRLTSATTNYTFISPGAYTVQYGYDAASNRNKMTDPQSVPTTYGYDTLNLLSSVTYNGQTPNFTFGYDALSRRTTLTRPNGIATSYGYDPVSRLQSVLHKLGTTTLDGATYTYYNDATRKTRTDKRTNVTLTYGYDNIYQLLSAKQGSTTKETYTYDLVGNRLSSLGVSPYIYNTSNELTSTPSGNYTYDNNGNTKSKPDGTTYTWDLENRLTQVVLPGTGGTVTFKYDPFGRRVQKSFVQGSTTTTTNYLYDGVAAWADVIEELDNNGNALAKYTQQHLETDQPLSELRSGTASYFLQDGLGSVTSLSNSAGALTNTYVYDSFGQRTAFTGTLTNPFQYTGRDFDSETDLYYYRARYYDTTTGRFLNEDPIGFRGGIDFYAYVKNNPVTLSDPTGQAASGGFGPEACDYYDKRCKAPCVVPKDTYACKAGQCCRDFGNGPKQNCVRQCLIERDRACIQQHGNSLPSCRFYNHVVCYTSCGFVPSSVSKSCLNIALGQ